MSIHERDIPEQNQPVTFSPDKLPTIFFWIIGGLSVALLTTFFYTLNRFDSMENKHQTSITNIENKHQTDHDKVIKLETIIENLKK